MLYPQCTVIVNINGLLRGTQGFDQNGSIDTEKHLYRVYRMKIFYGKLQRNRKFQKVREKSQNFLISSRQIINDLCN